ncbi:MAG TPA: GtrA family protein [Clostridia bacterium]|jgi:putative flippase GtrA|nr:GtrA family protein [Clostridiaceae bacterium]HOF26072.1 GtrA family protein [Clostridia bacterium]HOM34625.1 GtrA family protein [Clostridia bacterium]HOR89249.1 GtrA family protein [Clostridia bacterium]HOT71367.1 GtrA family protein [Clostridia bacterium]
MLDFLKKNRIFFTYVLIGTIATLLDMAILYILSDLLSLNYILSNCISVFCGISLSFFLNSRYNFKKTDRIAIKFIYFASVCIIGLLVGSSIFVFLYENLGIYKFISKALSVIIAGVLQFLFNKHVTFR